LKIVIAVFVEVCMIINTGDRKIKFNKSIFDIMRKYIQAEDKATEAGGIIIGRENMGNKNIIIEYITEPMPLDKRTRYSYSRKDKGHINYYNKIYDDYDCIYAYIGEWHTHPEKFPKYSIIDKNNWNRIGDENSNLNQYHIIVGTKSIGIWEYSYKQKYIKKIADIKWEKING